MKKKILSLTLICLTFSCFCQTPSIIEHIRFPVWAEVDAYPEWELAASEEEGEYAYPIQCIKELAPFLLGGMVYGWEFVYTPSDKARGVEEYFELKEINPGYDIASHVQYSSPWIEDNKFNCWVDYSRDEIQIRNYYLWSSIRNPVIQGRGYGLLEDGFDGIRKATEEAVKNAVREHYRSKIKNKPKEITGSVLMRKTPMLGVSQGRYVINLDFFLEYGRIKEYSQF